MSITQTFIQNQKNEIRDIINKITIIKDAAMAKDLRDHSTPDMFDAIYPILKRGRKPLFEQPMTAAQRARRYRANKKLRNETN